MPHRTTTRDGAWGSSEIDGLEPRQARWHRKGWASSLFTGRASSQEKQICHSQQQCVFVQPQSKSTRSKVNGNIRVRKAWESPPHEADHVQYSACAVERFFKYRNATGQFQSAFAVDESIFAIELISISSIRPELEVHRTVHLNEIYWRQRNGQDWSIGLEDGTSGGWAMLEIRVCGSHGHLPEICVRKWRHNEKVCVSLIHELRWQRKTKLWAQ